MKFNICFTILTFLILCPLVTLAASTDTDFETEKAKIKEVVRNSIGWALNKDKDLLFNSVARDSNFFIYHPDANSTIIGFDAFKIMVEQVFMNEAFKATDFDVKDLRITLSKSGDTAWFSSLLDDFGEWNGQSTSWINCRWTGVLEKRAGKWVIAQMHFSFPQERGNAEESDTEKNGSKKN